MKVISVKHKADIIKGEYQFADKVKKEVLSLLKVCNPISQDDSNCLLYTSDAADE